jgi:hypothetical protein
MKHILLVTFLAVTAFVSYAQCDKKVVLTASQTEHLMADSTVENVDQENTVLEFDKTTFTVTPGDRGTLSGKINSWSCDWPTPFKTGITRLKATLISQDGESKNLTITIEGKNGKIVVIATMDDRPDHKIRLVADKFAPKQ